MTEEDNQTVQDTPAGLQDGDPGLTGALVPAHGDALAELTAFLLNDGMGKAPDPATIAKAIMGQATLDGADPEEATRSIIARVLMAETVEDALAQSDIVGVEMLVNASVEIRGVKWMPSAYDKGPKCYAIMDTVDLVTSQARAVSCGAQTILAQLLRIQVGNAFPVKVKVAQAVRPTAAGNYPMWLEQPDPVAPQQVQAPF
ncbi:MAG: hypothetical protein ACRDUW_10855 [Pseudonocardiaceae bacterium]